MNLDPNYVEELEGNWDNDGSTAPEGTPQDGEGQSLEEILSQGSDQQAPPPKDAEQPKDKSEPGWMKARIEKAVQKELSRVKQETEAAIRAEYAPIREMLYQQEADKLVSSGKITDPALALQFVKMQKGAPAAEETPKPAPKERAQEEQETHTRDPMTEKYGKMLYSQARLIKEQGGPDVLAAFEKDPAIKAKVLSMEWDFEDVANYLDANPSKRTMPPTARAANAGGASRVNIENMGKDDLAKLNAQLEKGVRVDLRK